MPSESSAVSRRPGDRDETDWVRPSLIERCKDYGNEILKRLPPRLVGDVCLHFQTDELKQIIVEPSLKIMFFSILVHSDESEESAMCRKAL